MPAADRTFDNYYNEFSSLMTKFMTLSQRGVAYNTRSRVQINATNTTQSPSSGTQTSQNSIRGHGRGRGRTNPRGCGRSR